MEEKMKLFLQNSPLAEKVKLDGKVILQRTKLSPLDIYNIQQQKQYGPIPEKEQLCELEIGGQVLANGKIVKKHGEYFFKVKKLLTQEVQNENRSN